VGEERCSGIAVVVFIVLLVLVGLYHAYSRRQIVNKVKQEEQRQQAARDMFANELAENLGSLAMDEATVRAAHKSLGAISPEIKSLFYAIDDDGSGALSREEVAQLLADQGITVDTAYLNGVFDAYDLDQSNEIDLEEFAALYTVLLRKASEQPAAQPPAPVPMPMMQGRALAPGAAATGAGPMRTASGKVRPPPLATLNVSRGGTPPRGRPPPLP